MTAKQRELLETVRDSLMGIKKMDLFIDAIDEVLNEDSSLKASDKPFIEELKQLVDNHQTDQQAMPESPKPKPEPGKSDKHYLEQTLDVFRFIEEKGYSKELVSYMLYETVQLPNYPFPD
jgi:hypothetical protein